MKTTPAISEVRSQRWQDPSLRWGLVPTMGYLHEGHLSLVRQARAENDRVAVSIFVNPAQFAPTEDLSTYPRDLERDLALLRAEQVDLVFIPETQTIYPPTFQTYVTVDEVTKRLEGASRPTHFRGVATVVAKLFNIFQPHRAYFGQKDAQQTIVIQRMVQDLNFNLKIIIGPTVREADGLALSSRNKYLTPAERAAAPILHRALLKTEYLFRAGERNADRLRQTIKETIAQEPLARLDYVSIADAQTLAELTTLDRPALTSLAVFFGKTRLIDNLVLGKESYQAVIGQQATTKPVA
ncbi:MAG: pantoate--beta-alanine ligase [Chloroflexi bacterium]|nr:pantoate--beta-alanine ligase [Chloroflexota bacterium]MBP8057603.1 pantoate--beta-alanine ligase [Chloroflexota bacterium]